MNERYIVDVRSGCAAIVDTFNPEYSEMTGLDPWDPKVIELVDWDRYGYEFLYDPVDQQDRDSKINSLTKKCEELNKANRITQEHIRDARIELDMARARYKSLFLENSMGLTPGS